MEYPVARRDETVVEELHGCQVQDPYRWLEDPDSEETKEFVDKQNSISLPFLQDCGIREKFHARLREMWDFPKYGCPKKHGDKYFYYYNTGLQNQSVLYVQDSLTSEPNVFLDPNTLSDDGTISITSSSFSEDGKLFAYGISESGSDWNKIKFKEVDGSKDLDDVLKDVKFSSIAWTHDNKGIFYNRYLPESKADGTETDSNVNQKLYYHVLGTDQSADVLCAEFPEQPKWMIGAEVSDCGRYVVLSVREGCDPVNRLYFTDLSAIDFKISGILPYVKVVDNFDAEYDYITNEGSVFTFKTNLNAARYRLINIDFNISQDNWKQLVAEHNTDVLEWAACVKGNQLVLCYLSDVKNILKVFALSTGEEIRKLPLAVGSVVGFSGKKKHTMIFYKFVSFLTPGTIYKYDLSSNSEPEVFRQTEVTGFDATQYCTNQVFYSSKDGTRVPMFIVHRKDTVMNSDNPVLLYGYGGFNISITPQFSVSRTVFMQHLGGIVAVPNIRGGGEYGEVWHKAGCFDKKQNVFDDFQCAAQYLIDNKYTKPSKITINGGSNGGLLVGACANQRPDLFKCVIGQVGVMDMLRFHKFTIGHAWTTDFGCADKAEDFKYLIKYSPLHTVPSPEVVRTAHGGYPATLLLTGDHDDRVVPLHSLKFIAQLQHKIGFSKTQSNPLLIRVDTKSGHGAGKPTEKVLEEVTDIYCFMHKVLDLKWRD